jgi:Carbon-nitrogen hydrolase
MSSVTIAAVQAASVLMNQEATVAKAVELIAKAAAGGSRLVVFPEVFIPSTPVWVYHQPIWEGDDTWYAMLVDQAVTVPGPVTDRLGCAAHHPYRQPLLCRTPALMDRLRKRIADKRVLALVKAFLKAGILGQDGALRDSTTGVPQGGILSPVLANLALSVLDEHIAQIPGGPGSSQSQRATRRRKGLGNYRLVRYADDCAPRTLTEVAM